MPDDDLYLFLPPDPPAPAPAAETSDVDLDDFASDPIKPIIENTAPTIPLTQSAIVPFPLIDDIKKFTRRIGRQLLRIGPFSFNDLDVIFGMKFSGIYAIYYQGDLPVYQPLRSMGSTCSLYIGMSTIDVVSRLRTHRESLQQVSLGLENFTFRCVQLTSGEALLAEDHLVDLYFPFWNKILKGFGNNPQDEACNTKYQLVSLFDTFHPGRVVNARAQSRSPDDVRLIVEQGIPLCRAAYEQATAFLASQGEN